MKRAIEPESLAREQHSSQLPTIVYNIALPKWYAFGLLVSPAIQKKKQTIDTSLGASV